MGSVRMDQDLSPYLDLLREQVRIHTTGMTGNLIAAGRSDPPLGW